MIHQLPLNTIAKVTFYKRDEVMSDLICCDVFAADQTWTFHEELQGWHLLLEHLQKLPAFDRNWFAQVSQPPFKRSEVTAFSR